MVIDGTQGASQGQALVQLLNGAPKAGIWTSGIVYKLLCGYRSGPIDSGNLSDGPCAIPTYLGDTANILQGWSRARKSGANITDMVLRFVSLRAGVTRTKIKVFLVDDLCRMWTAHHETDLTTYSGMSMSFFIPK